MKHLAFERSKGVRAARFEERSLLPVSAACVVANAMRERLSALCAAEVDVRLFPPAIPAREAWAAIFRGARLYVVRGSLADAAVVLRAHDARALAALLFGETVAEGDRALSPIESEVTRRAVEAISITLAPVCGETRTDESAHEIDAVTYFEMHLVHPIGLCIGVALSREPSAQAVPSLHGQTLRAAAVTLSAELPLAALRAGAIAALRCGDVIAARGTSVALRANGAAIGWGICGVHARRYAVALA